MNSKQDGLTGPEARSSRPTAKDRSTVARKVAWLVGIFFLWGIAIFGVWHFSSEAHYRAVARIEILRTHDRFDPRVWFQEKFQAPGLVSASCEGREHSKASLARAKSLEQQYSDLRRDVDYKSDFHRLVRKEAQEWNVKSKTISNNIVIIDGPILSSSDDGNHRKPKDDGSNARQ